MCYSILFTSKKKGKGISSTLLLLSRQALSTWRNFQCHDLLFPRLSLAVTIES